MENPIAMFIKKNFSSYFRAALYSKTICSISFDSSFFVSTFCDKATLSERYADTSLAKLNILGRNSFQSCLHKINLSLVVGEELTVLILDAEL